MNKIFKDIKKHSLNGINALYKNADQVSDIWGMMAIDMGNAMNDEERGEMLSKGLQKVENFLPPENKNKNIAITNTSNLYFQGQMIAPAIEKSVQQIQSPSGESPEKPGNSKPGNSKPGNSVKPDNSSGWFSRLLTKWFEWKISKILVVVGFTLAGGCLGGIIGSKVVLGASGGAIGGSWGALAGAVIGLAMGIVHYCVTK